MAGRASGRHPEVIRTVVRLTSEAMDDLDRVMRKGDPQVVRWAFKKMIHLEQNREAGHELLRGLRGWRKITVGDRDWRLVWRVTYDDTGDAIVDVAEIWAFGARSDAEVYQEMESRIVTAPQTTRTRALADVLATFAQTPGALEATQEPDVPEPLPTWLRESLLFVVRLPVGQVDGLTRQDAEKVVPDDRPTPVQGHLAGRSGPLSHLSFPTSAWAPPQLLRG